MTVSRTRTEDALRAFFERRHPEYASKALHWAFLRDCYEGGREWFSKYITSYFKEGDQEFKARVERAYRFNHTREVVELVQKYLFKGDIARKVDEAPEVVKQFWKNATLSGLDIAQLMRQVSTLKSIGGRCAIVVDNNMVVDESEEGSARAVSIAEAKKTNARIYAYTVPVDDLLDYAYDEDGDGGLLWVKIRERARDDRDPINSSGDILVRVRLWTRTGWSLYEEVEVRTGRRSEPVRKVLQIASGTHNLGIVPVVLVDHSISSEPYKAAGLIDDIAYLDKAVANYLSNLDAIIQDQTFSQLAIPAQALMPGDETYSKVLEMGTKRIFLYDAGTGSTSKPEYLSPDPKQAGVIISVINKIINEIYHTIGLAGERTKEDNSQGIDNSSGVAKAYDFERVNSLLTSKAQACENAENQVIKLVCLWAGEKAPEEKLVIYPTTFDVMKLADELVTAEALGKLMAPAEVRREQMRLVVEKMFPRLKEDLKQKIMDDIEEWLGADDVQLNPPTNFGGAKPVAAPSRQGQVTKDTPKNKAA
jgi:hypothetical protein